MMRWVFVVLTLLILIIGSLVITNGFVYVRGHENILALHAASSTNAVASVAKDFKTVWFTDYGNSQVKAVNRAGQTVWEQLFPFPSVPDSGQPSNVEFMTVADNGDLLITTANGMLVQELDRATHEVKWHYGVLNQQYCDNCLHQPKKAYLMNDHEVLVTDANNRRVIIIDKNANKIVWQYGHTREMADKPGYLKGPRFAMPIDNNQHVLISDTLTKKIMIIDIATKTILWQWEKPDAEWLQNVSPTSEGTFIAEDHLHDEVWEVNQDGKIIGDLHTLADGKTLNYPTDAIKLRSGDVLIAEAGRGRIIEVNPQTKQVVWEYKQAGFPTSLAVEY